MGNSAGKTRICLEKSESETIGRRTDPQIFGSILKRTTVSLNFFLFPPFPIRKNLNGSVAMRPITAEKRELSFRLSAFLLGCGMMPACISAEKESRLSLICHTTRREEQAVLAAVRHRSAG